MCSIIASAVPSLFPTEDQCVNAFSSAGRTRDSPRVFHEASCSVSLRGSAQVPKLRRKLESLADESEQKKDWTASNLARWLAEGLLTQKQHEDLKWGLAAAAKLNANNDNDSLRDRVDLLNNGKFHISHFPLDFFEAYSLPQDAVAVRRNAHAWDNTCVADAIFSTPNQIRQHALARQTSPGHAHHCTPSPLELEGLEAARLSERAKRLAQVQTEERAVAAAAEAAHLAEAFSFAEDEQSR
jgi:hypothetical protein